MHVCGQRAPELVEGEQFLLPAEDSSGAAEARMKLFPGTYPVLLLP